MKIFIDTGGWISVVARTDRFHTVGAEFFRQAINNSARLFTTDYIMDETLTWLAYDFGHSVAAQFLTDINDSRSSGQLDLRRVDNDAWVNAELIFRQYSDVKLSFTDCTSFAMMRSLGLENVFGFDNHFEMMGFVLVPK